MASIALNSIGCINYLAYRTTFMCAILCLRWQERKIDVLFSAQKGKDFCWEAVAAEAICCRNNQIKF
jgi:hypothetical protein